MSKKYRFTKNEISLIQEWVNKNININIEIATSSRFECDTEEEIVYLSNKRWTRLDKFFYQWYEKQDFYTPIHYTLICILHEIGHIMTKDDSLLEEGHLLDEIYRQLYQDGKITEQKLNHAYFDIPSEKIATEWGVNFYRNNRQSCEKLAEMLGLNRFNPILQN